MSKRALLLLMTSLVFLVLIASEYGMSQDRREMSKWEYYDQICKARGWENPLTKPTGFADRKYGLFDVGKIRQGMPAELKVGAFPDRQVRGRLARIALQSKKKDNATVFQVEIEDLEEDRHFYRSNTYSCFLQQMQIHHLEKNALDEWQAPCET